MIYTAEYLDTFYLTDEELANSPSRKHDIDEETETTLRIFGCELIQEAGCLLKCPQAVMATGQVLFQRFFCRKSMRDYNVRRMACACLFLATKLEENHKRTRDILMVFDRINKRRDGSKSVPLLIPETKEYDVMKERVIMYERILLKTFGFIIHAVHPHKFVMSYVHSLEGSNELQQLAWNILNDSLRTTLCIRFKAHVVAAGAIYLAARRLQVPLPEHPPWWEAFKVPTEQLVEVVLTLHNLYQRPKAHYIEVNPDVLRNQQAVSGAGPAKQLTPGLEGNDSPAGPESSMIHGGPEASQQQTQLQPQQQPAEAPGAGPAPAAQNEMLAAAVAAARQRLQLQGLAAMPGTAAAQRLDQDVMSAVHQGGNDPGPTGGLGQANGGAASAVDVGAVQSKKCSDSRGRSRSDERGKHRSRSLSRSRSRSLSRDRERSRRSRSRSRDRDRQRSSYRKDDGRRERRSRSRSRDRRDRHWDRRDRPDRERERRERDGRGDRGRERDRERERGRDDMQAEANRGTDNKDDGPDAKGTSLPPPPPLPPRHPDRRR